MSYKNIPFGSAEKFNVVIEIQKGSELKYEYDEELDIIKLDWVFLNGFSFPFDYGYIPQTRGGDGDHLDVFVIGSHSIPQGIVVKCRPIGMIELLDRGEEDDKIIAIPISDSTSEKIQSLDNLNFDYKKIFDEFFKELAIQKNKTIEIKGYLNNDATLQKLELAYKNIQA